MNLDDVVIGNSVMIDGKTVFIDDYFSPPVSPSVPLSPSSVFLPSSPSSITSPSLSPLPLSPSPPTVSLSASGNIDYSEVVDHTLEPTHSFTFHNEPQNNTSSISLEHLQNHLNNNNNNNNNYNNTNNIALDDVDIVFSSNEISSPTTTTSNTDSPLTSNFPNSLSPSTPHEEHILPAYNKQEHHQNSTEETHFADNEIQNEPTSNGIALLPSGNDVSASSQEKKEENKQNYEVIEPVASHE